MTTLPETMTALVYDRTLGPWEETRGLRKVEVPTPRLDPTVDPRDDAAVIVEVMHAGFCGSDRGIWFRKAFKSMIHGSLDDEGGDVRVTGHELLGRIVEVGRKAGIKYGYEPGDVVSTESHIICGACYQCRAGDTHVCAEDIIIGISMDGCFAQYLKLPAKALWRTDLGRIRPEVAAIQEPFGNAVHACTKVDLRGKTVAIHGTGTIGLFAVLIARGLGAGTIVGVDPSEKHAEMARRLGADLVVSPDEADARILKATRGVGADVSLEMSGVNAALNSAIRTTRRGGDVILFGVRDGPMTVEEYGRLVMNGIALHSVVGRQIFETWYVTKSLLEDRVNQIQEKIWEVILNRGDGTTVHIDDWEEAAFQEQIKAWPKIVMNFGARDA